MGSHLLLSISDGLTKGSVKVGGQDILVGILCSSLRRQCLLITQVKRGLTYTRYRTGYSCVIIQSKIRDKFNNLCRVD